MVFQLPAGAATAPSEGLAPILTLIGGGAVEESAGIAAAGLVGPEGPILVVLGGILTQLLGSSGKSAQDVQNAINTALNANIAGNNQRQLNFGAQVYSAFKVNAILAENTAGAAYHAGQAVMRLRFYVGLLDGLVGGSVSRDELVADITSIEQQLSTLTTFTIQNLQAEQAARAGGIAQAESQATAQVQQAEQQAYNEAVAVLNQAVNEARVDSNTVVQWVQQVITDVFNDLRLEANQINLALSTLEMYVTQAVNDALLYAEQAVTQGIASFQAEQSQQLITTLTPTWAGTADSANQATDELVQQHPDEANNLYHMLDSVPGDMVSAIAGLSVGLKTATQALNDCALPMCKDAGKWAKDLGKLNGILGDGALLAFIVAAAHDPKGVAQAVKNIAEPPLHAVYDAAKGL